MIRDVLAAALLWAGVALQVLACAGVVLMRETLDRLHYLGPGAPAAALVAAALLVRDGLTQGSGRALMVLGVIALSGPVVANATARAVHRRGARR